MDNIRSSSSPVGGIHGTQPVGITQQSVANFKNKVVVALCATVSVVKNEIYAAKAGVSAANSKFQKDFYQQVSSSISSLTNEKKNHAVSSKSIENASSTTTRELTAEPSKARFDLQEAKSKIGNYELNKDMPPITDASREKLFGGCSEKEVTTKREAFLELLHSHLESGAAKSGKDKEVTTLEDLFGKNKDLLKAYKEAVKEEASSKSFRQAVFTDCSTQLERNPCPGKKMVMYIGGPSASGKSFTQDKLVTAVEQRLSRKGGESQGSEGVEGTPCYAVSVDGGKERELCQMRQMVLQAATKSGYGGISDLHKHTKTGVKGKVMKAAMNEGKNFHVVIPATFISGLVKFTNLMKTLSRDSGIFQVFAEVRADKTGPLSEEQANKSFQQTIVYNGESRAYLQENKEDEGEAANTITMNNRQIGCESKVYEKHNFKWGMIFSEIGKQAFKLLKSESNSMMLSNECDNMHVKKEGGRWVQTTENPTVKHVSLREVNLWNMISSSPFEDDIKHAFKSLNTEQDKSGEYDRFKGLLAEARQEKGEGYDLPDFIKLLKDNGFRSNLKVTESK